MSEREGKRSDGGRRSLVGAEGFGTGPLQMQALVERFGAVGAQRYAQRKGVQRQKEDEAGAVREAAAESVAGAGGELPYLEKIRESFGERHEVASVAAHVDEAAASGLGKMGAAGVTVDGRVALERQASLHTVAHEAAHVIQQRGGLSLAGGVGQVGDRYEQHADAVADLVVQGKSSAGLLDEFAGGGGGGGQVQQKNLRQYNLANGLTNGAADVDTLVSYNTPGRVYSETVAAVAANRTEAIKVAAARNADVGNRTVGLQWTGDGFAFDQNGSDRLDPFLYKVNVRFQDGHNVEQLTLLYQHASKWTGYVTSIEDTSNQTTDGGVTMYDAGVGPQFDSDSFSNVHEVDATDRIADRLGGASEGDLDAYTKLAGEGARWQCVRAHAAQIKDNTYFFTENPDDATQVYGISFVNLWRNWKDAFGKRYDIPDEDVVDQIWDFLLPMSVAVDKTALRVKDYDLDAHAGYVPAAP